ncbi:MAG: RagB/SusD family nutrient uptake outer membrane protein [Saprospiraceae bacterium]
MYKSYTLSTILLFLLTLFIASCDKDYGNLNNPTVDSYYNNANKSQLNNLVTGTESAMRNSLGFYLDDIGIIGREIYRFSNSDPRYYTDLLGANDAQLQSTGFYIVNVWASRYRVIKNCNLLIESANKSNLISDSERKAYVGFAKTIKAYQLLLVLNLTNKNGIRIDVSNPDQLGPIVGYDEALSKIADLLDEASNDLVSAQISFPLSSGFSGFNDAAGLIKFNKAIAARVAVYQNNWDKALTYLNSSFFNLNGNFNSGVFNVFATGSGDQLNPAFFPQNSAGEARAAHPSFSKDIDSNDDRISKATLRTTPISNSGLTSDRDVWVYKNNTAAIPIIRNEELILIYAEANIQKSIFSGAVTAINIIRNGHRLANYSGAMTQSALIDEMLLQRRYSLFSEGHRWLDVRRYNLLNTLPIDRANDDVWSSFPLPSTE